MSLVILSVGKDEVLLHSRNAILRAAGYVVIAETSFRRAILTFNSGDYDAVLLCHSLDPKSVKAFAKEVHERSPSTPVAQVAATWPYDRQSEVVPIESEPHKMLASLHELIEQAVSHSRRASKPGTTSEAPDA